LANKIGLSTWPPPSQLEQYRTTKDAELLAVSS
jgi:hypothetical protein